VLVRLIFQKIAEINAEGTTVLLVEQNANAALRLAQRAYVLENGRVALEGPAADLARNEAVRRAYLGIGANAGGR
jgi:branched-chain amino acid transport system ATP-binding protein